MMHSTAPIPMDRSIPVDRDRGAARAAFMKLQAEQLAFYGVRAESRYIETRNPHLHVHLLQAGGGEPALIFHGGDGEAVTWAPLMAVLQGELAMYAIDRPGFGLTDAFDYRSVDLRQHAADFVVSVLDALGLSSATLIGGSMGGFFSLAASLAHPERVRKLILVGMPVGLLKSASWPLRILCGVPGLARRFMRKAGTLEGQHEQYRGMFQIDPASVPELYFRTRLAGLAIPGAKETWAILLRRLAGLGGFRKEVYLGNDLPGLQPPTLIVWGERDMAPAEEGEAQSRRIPKCAFKSMDGIGHFPFLEAPEKTAAHIRGFLTS